MIMLVISDETGEKNRVFQAPFSRFFLVDTRMKLVGVYNYYPLKHISTIL